MTEAAMSAGEDPRRYARLLSEVYDATMSGTRPPARPRGVIGDSWDRVLAAGLAPDADPGPAIGTADLERGRQDSGLALVLEELTAGLAPVTADGDNILVIADRRGRVLWRSGATRVLSHADRLGFVEGVGWAEDQVGTNAIGTALASGEPVQIFSAEHFARSHHAWTCAGAPIRDVHTGRILGVVDVSGPAASVHPTTLALVSAVARLAESRLREVHLAGLDRLRSVAAPMLAGLGRPGVAVDVNGWVAAVGDLPPRTRITLPTDLAGPSVWLPELGLCAVDPLPGGWLLQPDTGAGADPVTRVTVDLRPARPAEVVVAGAAGSWRYRPSPRHAQILAVLADGAGHTAAQLAQALFGDDSRVVTVRAEISRLRRVLSGLIAAQPYRFADGVSVELLR
ncbi:helix-turn-helix domain-containing protein [Tsukamurella sp. 1534]|uniref:helix-turn-helix domain-containing protein n=1 Tax=Tsukamurella sp. 1534 TaxID=1151061 RepID=UPI000308FD29|nr:helix-turn-helix domain-containing protein [Tsukamurella sp. 1534]